MTRSHSGIGGGHPRGRARSRSTRATGSDQLRAILNGIPAMIGYWDTDLRNVMGNDAYVEYFGFEPEAMLGRHISEVLGPDLYERNRPYMLRALAGEAQLFDREIIDQSGATRYTQASYIPDVVDGEVRGFFVLVTDISARREAERALADEKQRMATILDAISEGVFSLDGQGAVVHVNAAGSRLLRRDEAQVLGRRIDEAMRLQVVPRGPSLIDDIDAVARTGVPRSVEHCAVLIRGDETTVPVDYHVVRIPRDRDSRAELVVTVRDVTSSRRLLQETERRALRDPLTGLLNREHLKRRTADGADAPPSELAVVMLDLDGFKAVNDTWGHEAGDHVLCDVATLLRQATRAGDEIVRIGGDEFVILLDDCGPRAARRLADDIVTAVAVHPFEYGGHRVGVGVSAGVAAGEGDASITLTDLLRDADRASYEAKRAGGGRVALARRMNDGR